jgi:hypothetical protein
MHPRGTVFDGRRERLFSGSIWRRARSALKLLQVRLRVPLVLVFAAFVVGQWDVIRNYWDKVTRPALAENSAMRAVSSDTEYFCPMDPGVLSDWPGKCGICNMALVRRKRGEAVALPDGVVARMQLSPYRVQLAGIQTTPVNFRPLVREVQSAGLISIDRNDYSVQVDMPTSQSSWVSVGDGAEVVCPDLAGHDPLTGQVRAAVRRSEGGWDSIRATVVVDRPPHSLAAGMMAVVRIQTPMAAVEPFRSLPSDPPPIASNEIRRVYTCPDHAETLSLEPGRCPVDRNPREPRLLAGHQRLRFHCPMHPDVSADRPGAVCRACGGMDLAPRVISFNPPGQVLAVPRSAVVDAGSSKVVFVERMPGMFDGVEVVVGPRSGAYFPVVRGLEPGQNVATSGAFLLDAETRLNPNLATAYFGAARSQRASPGAGTAGAMVPIGEKTAASGSPEALDGLSAADRALAERQGVCPVTGKRLGSMGTPSRLVVSGRTVFLCCDGCEEGFQREPAKYLAKLAGSKRP